MKAILAVPALAVFLFLGGCGEDESRRVYSGPEGKVEVTTSEGDGVKKMTVTTEEGTATVEMGTRSIPPDLGVPIYPGVKTGEGGTWSMTGKEQGAAQAFSSTVLLSGDSIDKVAAFYKDGLAGRTPQVFDMTTPDGRMVNFTIEEGSTTTSVMLSENRQQGGTNIQIMKANK